MIAHADDGEPLSMQLPDTLAEQLAAISVTPEHHDALVEAVTGRLRNPTDHIGRTAHEIALMREAGYAITPTPECVGCGNRLVFISGTDDGDRRKTPHLRHPSRSSCPGGFVTPWHVAMQKAAKAAGFTTEHTVSVLGRIRRLDAYSESCRVALEFVHSLSDSYIEKHRDLVASGDSVRWVFNSAASFTTPLRNEFVHLPSLREGRIVLGGLLRPSAIKLIESLGYRNVFMWYRSVILGCVGVDLWSPVPADHPLALLCRREQGFNDQLFRMGRTFKRALDGTVTDLADPITRDARIEFLNREDPRALELIRHDCAPFSPGCDAIRQRHRHRRAPCARKSPASAASA